MRIICPNCTAEYEVPVSRVTQHRLVRCARCHTAWAPVAAAPDSALAAAAGQPPQAETESLPPITAMDRLAAPPQGRASSPALLAAWAVSLAVLAGGAAATITWRESVMRAWPASALVLAPFSHQGVEAAQADTPKPAAPKQD